MRLKLMWTAVRWAQNRLLIKYFASLIDFWFFASTIWNQPSTLDRLLQDKFSPSPSKADLSDISNYKYPSPIVAHPFTVTEIHQATMRPAALKAHGPTLIPHVILQILAPYLSPLLQRVFNVSLELGYCTKLFRDSVTVAMQKLHKDNYVAPHSWRFIMHRYLSHP